MGDPKEDNAGLTEELKAAHERLAAPEKAEAMHRAVFEDSLEAMSITQDGRVVDVNPAWLRLHGFERKDEVLGMEILDVLHPEDRDMLQRRRSMRSDERERVFQVRDVRRDGSVIHVEVYSSEIQVDGRSAILATLRDITERKHAEEALRGSEERYRRITEAVTDYIYTVRVESGRAIETVHGPACEAVTGYNAEEFACDPFLWIQMVPVEDRDIVREQAARILSGGDPEPIEHRIVRNDGEVRWVRNTPVPCCDVDGRLASYDGLVRDITERKRLERELRRAQRMESIGTLAGGVAHNFNNILGIILGNTELLKMSLGGSHEAVEFLDKISVATERAAGLAQQLLSVARRQSVYKSVTNPVALVDGVLQAIRLMLDSNIHIDQHVSDTVPMIVASPAEMEQVLMNLLVNARDAMPRGGRIGVEVKAVDLSPEFCDAQENMTPGRYVCISVSDTGTGMDAEMLSQIFDPFFTTKEPGEGTGLGLATAYGAVVNHGGCIEVDSELGKGTTFRIHLPAAEGDAVAPSSPSSIDQTLRSGSETLLVVDDEESILGIARRCLEGLGYSVLTAGDGATAVKIYREEGARISLVLLDYMMPEMLGEDVYHELKRIDPAVKVVVASGYEEGGRVKPLLDAGVGRFVHKPYRLVELAQAVRAVLDET